MLSIFNNTRPSVVILLLGYLIIIHGIGFSVPVVPKTQGGPLYEVLFGGVESPLFSVVLNSVFILIDALILNAIAIKRRINFHRDYFIAAIFILLSGGLIAFQHLSPLPVGGLFVILAMDRLLDLSRNVSHHQTLYHTGLLLGTAALFSPHYLVFFIPAMISALFFPLRRQSLVALFLGWLNPFLLAGTGFYLADSFNWFLRKLLNVRYATYFSVGHWGWKVYLLLAIFFFLLTTAVLIQNALLTKQHHFAKQIIRVVYNFLFTAAGSLLFLNLSKDLSLLFLPVPFLAFIFGVFVKRYTRRIPVVVEFVHLLMVLLVLLNLYKYQIG